MHTKHLLCSRSNSILGVGYLASTMRSEVLGVSRSQWVIFLASISWLASLSLFSIHILLKFRLKFWKHLSILIDSPLCVSEILLILFQLYVGFLIDNLLVTEVVLTFLDFILQVRNEQVLVQRVDLADVLVSRALGFISLGEFYPTLAHLSQIVSVCRVVLQGHLAVVKKGVFLLTFKLALLDWLNMELVHQFLVNLAHPSALVLGLHQFILKIEHLLMHLRNEGLLLIDLVEHWDCVHFVKLRATSCWGNSSICIDNSLLER